MDSRTAVTQVLYKTKSKRHFWPQRHHEFKELMFTKQCLGTQIGLGRGRQNERDLVMVKDPLIDFEEVVVGIWSLGSNPMARRDTYLERFFQITIP